MMSVALWLCARAAVGSDSAATANTTRTRLIFIGGFPAPETLGRIAEAMDDRTRKSCRASRTHALPPSGGCDGVGGWYTRRGQSKVPLGMPAFWFLERIPSSRRSRVAAALTAFALATGC